MPKADKSVRICGDYKVTINSVVEDEQYPLPTQQDLYAALSRSKFFSKLDLSHAYAQLSVDKASREYVTVSTHKGLYSYTKLPYGVKSAPKIFQAKMDMILQGVEKCVCKQDDILIGGVSRQENIKILAEVLERLHKYNLHLKMAKCEFLKSEVVYLGLKIDAEGLHPVEDSDSDFQIFIIMHYLQNITKSTFTESTWGEDECCECCKKGTSTTKCQ